MDHLYVVFTRHESFEADKGSLMHQVSPILGNENFSIWKHPAGWLSCCLSRLIRGRDEASGRSAGKGWQFTVKTCAMLGSKF
jgi:hypothetical protein